MTECVSNDLYKSLGFCQGKPVLPGIRRRVYYQKKNNIAKWPKLPELDAEGATMEKIATYEGDFTLAADKLKIVRIIIQANGQRFCFDLFK